MNAKKLCLLALSSLMFSLPFASQAAIIDGTFKAKVTSGDPQPGLWGDILGETVTGTFFYDSDLKFALSSGSNEVRYIRNDANAFVNMTINIAGNTFDISHDYTDRLGIERASDFVIVKDAFPSVAEDSDYFMVLDALMLGDFGAEYLESTLYFYLWEAGLDTVKTLDVEQAFHWVSGGNDASGGFGSFYYNYNIDGVSRFSFVTMDLEEVIASLRTSSVPEPSPWVLLGTTFLGVVLRRKLQVLR